MTYIRVTWLHDDPGDPVVIYSELDAARWEVRKVEVFRDGRRGYADATGSHGGTFLGEVVVPPIAAIAADPEFEPVEIAQDEFESVWARRNLR